MVATLARKEKVPEQVTPKDDFASDFAELAQNGWTAHRCRMTALKIVVERHSDGYVAYPLGLARGTVLGQGDSYEEALSDVRSAIAFHIETFGAVALAPAHDTRCQFPR